MLKYLIVLTIYYWFVFTSILNDTLRKIWKMKPIPFTERENFVAVVTGGGRGLGEHIVRGLLKCKMTVVVGVRRPELCKELVERCAKLPGKIELIELDTSCMKSVRKFAEIVREKHPLINLLVNNAGIIARDKEETDEGFEPILATNYLGHFLLTHLLLKNMHEAGNSTGVASRIVHVSSCAHVVYSIDLEDINMKKHFIRYAAYGRSKLAQLMFSRYMDAFLKEKNSPVMSIACHPGVVATNMSSDWKQTCLPVTTILRTEEEGARNPVFCCLDPSFRGGEYFYNDSTGFYTSESDDATKQRALFSLTCKMLDIPSFFEEI